VVPFVVAGLSCDAGGCVAFDRQRSVWELSLHPPRVIRRVLSFEQVLQRSDELNCVDWGAVKLELGIGADTGLERVNHQTYLARVWKLTDGFALTGEVVLSRTMPFTVVFSKDQLFWAGIGREGGVIDGLGRLWLLGPGVGVFGEPR
jgi:hypothetical protein